MYNLDDPIALCARNLEKEFDWIQATSATKTFQNVLTCLRDCCVRLHLGHKCDSRLAVPTTQPTSDRHSLVGKHGGDNLKATVALLGDNVIQAEVAIKHQKTPGGVFRAVAQPDVQWKLQQLQDLGNHIARASVSLCDVQQQMKEITGGQMFNSCTGDLILSAALSIKEEISSARSAILLPRKRSLLELCHFPPTRRFAPPLPQDQLLSFYISSCRLVCASYQMVPKQNAPQGLTISMAECQLPYLDDVLKQLNAAMSSIQKLIGDLEMCKAR